jgi:hypothetical protein
MPQVAIIGVDLAKRVFQLHGAAADGSVVKETDAGAGFTVCRIAATLRRGNGGLRDRSRMGARD